MTRKTTFSDAWSWFKFNNVGLAIDILHQYGKRVKTKNKVLGANFCVCRSYRGKTGFITYIFSLSLKFGACYMTVQWSEFRVKNVTIYFHIYFFVIFHELCFYHFITFGEVTNFRNRILTNQKLEYR